MCPPPWAHCKITRHRLLRPMRPHRTCVHEQRAARQRPVLLHIGAPDMDARSYGAFRRRGAVPGTKAGGRQEWRQAAGGDKHRGATPVSALISQGGLSHGKCVLTHGKQASTCSKPRTPPPFSFGWWWCRVGTPGGRVHPCPRWQGGYRRPEGATVRLPVQIWPAQQGQALECDILGRFQWS